MSPQRRSHLRPIGCGQSPKSLLKEATVEGEELEANEAGDAKPRGADVLECVIPGPRGSGLGRDHRHDGVSRRVERLAAQDERRAPLRAWTITKRKRHGHDVPGLTDHGTPRRPARSPTRAWSARAPRGMPRRRVRDA